MTSFQAAPDPRWRFAHLVVIRGRLKKPHEHGFQLVGRNADSGVTDREANLVSDAFDVDDRVPVSRRELDLMAQKIGQHLNIVEAATAKVRQGRARATFQVPLPLYDATAAAGSRRRAYRKGGRT